MKGLFVKNGKTIILVIAAVVDIYSLIQIVRQTNFKMREIVNNEWFWLIIVVTLTLAVFFVYFSIINYINSLNNKFDKLEQDIRSLKAAMFDIWKKDGKI
jgi:magnesium-transporting ATPase (P-type)